MFKNKFSIEQISKASTFYQLLILLVFSVILISIFGFLIGSISKSVELFLKPVSITSQVGLYNISIGFIEIILGILFFGTIISILTSARVEFISNIKSGSLPYKRKNHFVIINKSKLIPFILKELNLKMIDENSKMDVVICIPMIGDKTSDNLMLPEYSNINVFIRSGNPYTNDIYKKINIRYSDEIIILHNSDLKNDMKRDNLNLKILSILHSNNKFAKEDGLFTVESASSRKTDLIIDSIMQQHGMQRYSVINPKDLIPKLITRSLINLIYYDFFKEIASYKGCEIYEINYSKYFDTPQQFQDVHLKILNGSLIGVQSGIKTFINPHNYEIQMSDILLILLEVNEIEIGDVLEYDEYNFSKIKKPQLKEYRKMCIIGGNDEMSIKGLSEFLDVKSIQSLKTYVNDEKDYLNSDFWNKIFDNQYDVILLNLEDELEFHVTLYVNALFDHDKKFLDKIINIIRDTDTASLLESNDIENSVIISEKLVSQFITQAAFSPSIVPLLNQITQAEGYEPYVLNNTLYSELFDLDFNTLKLHLIKNQMIFLGIINNGKLFLNCKQVEKSDAILVLACGGK
ncbi:MAG: hypothetical protein GY707_08580 [Desulfobacteraceae bacterium]|nr:hypothetical protein [Desulfobacteraceae bacterium]